MKLGEQEHTERGFPIVRFNDFYGTKCSIQNSSLADEDALWIGVSDAEPKVLASQARRFGVETTETTGWVPFPVPEDILLTTRMHLNRDQVECLINHLEQWLETGEPGL